MLRCDKLGSGYRNVHCINPRLSMYLKYFMRKYFKNNNQGSILGKMLSVSELLIPLLYNRGLGLITQE